ncbi:MAG: hypothetical protein GQ552_01945 [Flavobacteriaceae bacterium]|nr:hypothetical protein [Flavobacteriaceae bacterium]
MKIVYPFLALLFFVSCKTEVKKAEIKEKLIMYQASEMTELMRGIYEYNKLSKHKIENDQDLFGYPDEFQKISTAKLTDPSDRDTEFDSLAVVFLENQKAAYTFKGDLVKYSYNKSINACISCHQTRCTGPLPKIRKLLIP